MYKVIHKCSTSGSNTTAACTAHLHVSCQKHINLPGFSSSTLLGWANQRSPKIRAKPVCFSVYPLGFKSAHQHG